MKPTVECRLRNALRHEVGDVNESATCRSRFAFLGFVLIVLAWMSFRSVCAHPGFPASALLKVDASGHVVIHVRHDALAFALNETPLQIADEPMRKMLNGSSEDLQAALDEGRHRFEALCVLTADGRPVSLSVKESPTVEHIEAAKKASTPVRLPIMLDFVAEASLGDGVRTFSILFPEILGDVIMTVERPGHEPFSIPLRAGEQSSDF